MVNIQILLFYINKQFLRPFPTTQRISALTLTEDESNLQLYHMKLSVNPIVQWDTHKCITFHISRIIQLFTLYITLISSNAESIIS